MSERRPLTRQSARRGQRRSYLVVTPLPEELLGGAPHLASVTNPHAPLPGYGYNSPAEPQGLHTKLVGLLEAGWMLDAWDKLPQPQQAPYVDAALAEMGHDAGQTCAAPASPPPRPRACHAACAAEPAAAAPAPGVPCEAVGVAAGVHAAADSGEEAGGLLALSLLSCMPPRALRGNVQVPQDSCTGTACPSRGSTTGSSSSAATQLHAASKGGSHSSSASSPACAAGVGEAAAALEAQHAAAPTEQPQWQPHWRQQQQQQQQQEGRTWPPHLRKAVQVTGGPELVLRLQTLLQWQRHQPQQERCGSVQQRQPPQQQPQPLQQSLTAAAPQAREPEPHAAQRWPLPWRHAAAQQTVLAAEVPHAPGRQAEQPPPKRPALQAAAGAVPELRLPAPAAELPAGVAAAPRLPAAGLPACTQGAATLQRQPSGCSALTLPGSAGLSSSKPVACGPEHSGGASEEEAGGADAAMEEDGEEEDGGSDGGGGSSRRERKREPPRYRVKDVTLEVLQQEGCFNMTQVEAARHLSFGSPTSIKAIMKRLGILKWPYRKKSTIGKMLGNMEEFVRRYCEPGIVEKVLARAREAYQELEVYEKCTTGAPPPLAEELRALRQKVYKLKDQDKHGHSEDSMRRCVAQLVGKVMLDAAAVRGA